MITKNTLDSIVSGTKFMFQGVLHEIVKVDRLEQKVDVKDLEDNEIQRGIKISNLIAQLNR